ncbi:MAG: UTRA domain-containing protein, partial [Thermomicrobiales bacterium]
LGVRLTVHAVASTFLFGSEDRIVFEISRLFVVDEDPFALERIYLPTEIGELLPVERIRSAVIDDLIREMAGIAVDHGYETIELAKLDREQAALLGARRGDAAFLITRMVSSAEQPLQVRQTLIRGERVRFHIGLQGPDLAPGADVGVLMSSNRQIT